MSNDTWDEEEKAPRTPLDDIAHTGMEDCGYEVGRECDCPASGDLLDRMRRAGYALVPIDTSKRPEGIIR